MSIPTEGFSPIDLETWSKQVDEEDRIEDFNHVSMQTKTTKLKHLENSAHADSVSDWDHVQGEWEAGRHGVLQDYLNDIWGSETTQDWLRQTQTKHAPEGGIVIGTDSAGNVSIPGNIRQTNNLNDIKSAILAYWSNNKHLDLEMPAFGKGLSIDSQIITKDKEEQKQSIQKVTEQKARVSLGQIQKYYDQTFDPERIKSLKESGSPNYAVLMQHKKEVDAILATGVHAQYRDIKERQADLFYKYSTEDRRRMSLAELYREIPGVEGLPPIEEINYKNLEEVNNTIESIVYKAQQGFWDHDTNMEIMNLYVDSIKNFAASSGSNTLLDAFSKAVDRERDMRSDKTKVSFSSTLRGALLGASNTFTDAFRDAARKGTTPSDVILQTLEEERTRMNNEATVAYQITTGSPYEVELFKAEDWATGNFGISWENLDPHSMYAAGLFMTSEMLDHGHKVSEFGAPFRAMGDHLYTTLQLMPFGDFTDQAFAIEWMQDPSNAKDFERATFALSLLGDIVSEGNRQKGGLGNEIVNKMMEGLGDSGIMNMLLRGAGLDLRTNLGEAGLTSASIPEIAHGLSSGKDAITLETHDPDTGEKSEITLSPAALFGKLWQPIFNDGNLVVTALRRQIQPSTRNTDIEAKKVVQRNIEKVVGTGGFTGTLDPARGGMHVDKDQIDAWTDLNVISPYWTDGSSGAGRKYWSKELGNIQNNKILSKTLNTVLEGDDLTAGVERNKVIAMLNTYAADPLTRAYMQSILAANYITKDSISPSRIINLTDRAIGAMGGMIIAGEDTIHGHTSRLEYIPLVENLEKIPLFEGQTGDAWRANRIAQTQIFTEAVDPAFRDLQTATSFFFRPNVLGKSIVPIEEVDYMNSLAFRHTSDLIGSHFMDSLGYDNTDEGKLRFKTEVMDPMWEQEAVAWTDSQANIIVGKTEKGWFNAPYRSRTNLDWTLGASANILKKLTADRGEEYLLKHFTSLIPLFKTFDKEGVAEKGKHGRFFYLAEAKLATSAVPLGALNSDPDIPDSPVMNIVIHTLTGGRTYELPLGISLMQEDINHWISNKEKIDLAIGEYSNNNWEFFREIMRTAGIDWTSAESGGLMQAITQFFWEGDRVNLHDMQENWQAIEDSAAREAMLSIQKYYYYHGEYPQGFLDIFPMVQAINTGRFPDQTMYESVAESWREGKIGEAILGEDLQFEMPDGTVLTYSEVKEELSRIGKEEFLSKYGGKGRPIERERRGLIGGVLNYLAGEEEEETSQKDLYRRKTGGNQ